MEARRLWLRLAVLNAVLLATLAVFVFFESWLIDMNVRSEGLLAQTLEMVKAGETVVSVLVVLAGLAVAVVGVVAALSREQGVWSYLLLGIVFLALAWAIFLTRPSAEDSQRALAVQPGGLSQSVR